MVIVGIMSLVVACGGTAGTDRDAESISGVVVAVDGSLQGIDRFTVLDANGVEKVFVPGPESTFGDEGPLSHLFDHLRNGEPVYVEFVREEGALIARHVGDTG